jgi:aldehyde dehydrogenase (NAD+)
LKSALLELGGKSAHLVLDDADLAEALSSSASVCTHAGQGCAVSSRLLVPKSRYGEAVAIVKELMEAVNYVDPTDRTQR